MPHCICIDYDSANLSFLSLDSFCIPFDTQKRANPVIRKIILIQKIILKPGEAVFTRTHYVTMPSKHSFLFSAIYPAATNALIDSKTSKIAYIVNLI